MFAFVALVFGSITVAFLPGDDRFSGQWKVIIVISLIVGAALILNEILRRSEPKN